MAVTMSISCCSGCFVSTRTIATAIICSNSSRLPSPRLLILQFRCNGTLVFVIDTVVVAITSLLLSSLLMLLLLPCLPDDF